MLKLARYKCWGYGRGPALGLPEEFPEYNKVVYAIVGDCCYFSGIERERRTSTINAAESIITAISKREGIPVVKLRWFDLQTHCGYHSKKPGEYVLDELLIGPSSSCEVQKARVKKIEVVGEPAIMITAGTEDFVITGWQPTPCPPEVLELFRQFIG